MPYNDDGNYVYEVEVPASGDSLRKAAMQLAYDIESYLFNYAHPGYDNKAFLSWAHQHFTATHQSSGMQANAQFRWDPQANSQDQRETHSNEGKTHERWGGKSAVQNGLTYPGAAFDHPDIDTSPDVPGEAELYNVYEVTNPAHASEVNGNAVVVAPRVHEAADEPEGEDE